MSLEASITLLEHVIIALIDALEGNGGGGREGRGGVRENVKEGIKGKGKGGEERKGWGTGGGLRKG